MAMAPEAMAVTMEAEEGLLGRVLGLLTGAQHAEEHAKDPRFMTPHEGLEGQQVATLPAVDELAVRVLDYLPALSDVRDARKVVDRFRAE